MITIEDLLEELEHIVVLKSITVEGFHLRVNPITSSADLKFLQELSKRTSTGGCFSTKQAFIACKIIKKYAHLYEGATFTKTGRLSPSKEQITAICDNPVYRTIPYESTNVPREVRLLGNRKLGFKSKYSPIIINKIKSLSDKSNPISANFPYFNKKYRIWVVDVTERNLQSVMKVIKKFNFEFDEEVVQFLSDCSNSINQTSVAIVNNENNVIHVVNQNNALLSSWVEDLIQIEDSF